MGTFRDYDRSEPRTGSEHDVKRDHERISDQCETIISSVVNLRAEFDAESKRADYWRDAAEELASRVDELQADNERLERRVAELEPEATS